MRRTAGQYSDFFVMPVVEGEGVGNDHEITISFNSRIPPVENGPFRPDFFAIGFFWSFSLSSAESILPFLCFFS